jgi:hypothetical protein
MMFGWIPSIRLSSSKALHRETSALEMDVFITAKISRDSNRVARPLKRRNLTKLQQALC